MTAYGYGYLGRGAFIAYLRHGAVLSLMEQAWDLYIAFTGQGWEAAMYTKRVVRSITDKQKRFADEYLINCNGTRAYKAAYPSVKKDVTAAAGASALLRNPKVKAYIDEQMEKLHSEKVADAREVLEYLTSVMRGESTAEIVVVEGLGDGCSAARNMQKAPDEKERLKAAELLWKHYGSGTAYLAQSAVSDPLTEALQEEARLLDAD